MKRIIAFLFACLLMFTAIIPGGRAFADEQENVVHIQTAADLKKMVQDCRLDSYSNGITFELDNDIELGEEPFTPIPTFAGTFHGNGHTVKGYVCANKGSNQGFFRYIEATGVVEGLNVQGKIEQEESEENIGGIVGTNYGTVKDCSFDGTVSSLLNTGGICGYNYGKIINCSAAGEVCGKQYTGGICGFNEGEIEGCSNAAEVNTKIRTGSLDINDLTLIDLTSLESISSMDSDTVMDTGGITGGSNGVIRGCKNQGVIGYQHFGYNIGGISGRQSGFITDCENYGEIYGRKDLGGICGQMEPYMFLEDNEDLVEELQKLNDAIAKSMEALAGDASAMSGAMNSLKSKSDSATESAKNYKDTVNQLYKDNVQSSDSSGSSDDKSFGDKVSDAATNAGNVAGGLDQSTKDDITSGNVSDDTIKDVQDSLNQNGGSAGGSISDAIDKVQGDAGNIDQSTKDDITNGNISSDDVDNIKDTVSNSAAAEAIDKKKQEKAQQEAEEAAKKKKQETALANAQQALSAKVNSIGQALANLNDDMADIAGHLAVNLTEVNNQYAKVNRLLTRILTGDMTYYEDVSILDTENDTDGKVSYCTNYGPVSGDQNIGGVAGEMAIELEIDAEGSITSGLAIKGIEAKLYETRCVIRKCNNQAAIDGRKIHVGGIVGDNTTGMVFYCNNFGDVHSDASYVGGIAGISANYILAGYSMCKLSGEKYVGGIAGSGGQITDSFAVVTIEDEHVSCNGAIAGYLDVTKENAAKNNFFVSDSLGGIDGISYKGKAEPTTYEKLTAMEGVPENFQSIIVTFMADDIAVKVITVEYGKDISEEDIPQVPTKDGYIGAWELFERTNIQKAFTVQALYTMKETSVASELTREETGRPVILAEGDFAEIPTIEITSYDGELPSEISGNISEAIRIVISGDENASVSRLRYLPAENNTDGDIYILNQTGEWEKAAVEVKGSYMCFKAEGADLVIAATKTNTLTVILHFLSKMKFLLAGIAAFGVLGGLVVFAIRKASGKSEKEEE